MFNRRYWNRYKLRIIGVLIVCSVIYLFSFSRPTTESISIAKNGFSNTEIEYELQKYNRLKAEYQLTGLILHWKRTNGVRNLVRTMLNYEAYSLILSFGIIIHRKI